MKNVTHVLIFTVVMILNCSTIAAQITQRGEKTTNNTLTNSLTLSVPSGIQVDDILLVQIVQSDNDNDALSDAMSPGWTLVKGRKVKSHGGREWWATLVFKRVTSLDLSTSSYTFTLDEDAVEDGAAGEMIAFYGLSWNGLSVTGVANAGPFDNVIPSSDYSSNSGNAANLSTLAITTINSGSGVIMFSAIGNARYHKTWNLNGIGMTEICDYPNILAANNGSGVAWRTQLASGLTGPGATHLSKGAGGGAILVSLKSQSAATIVAVGSTSFCPGGNAELQANTGVGYTFQWHLNGADIIGATASNYIALLPGNYTATVTNAAGVDNLSGVITVVVLASPQVQIVGITSTSVCLGETVTLSSAVFNYAEYLWLVDGVNDTTAIDSVYSPVTSSTISLQVLSADGCYGTSEPILVSFNAEQEFFADTDGDSFGDVTNSIIACTQPQGYVLDNTDCDDTNSSINPNAIEICNSLDDECDGQVDNGMDFQYYYSDLDADGFGFAAGGLSCSDMGVGFVTNHSDCDDTNASVCPGAIELCNSIDDDCDSQIDNGLLFLNYFTDTDGDTFGTDAPISSCSDLGNGYSFIEGDCNDSDATVNPSAVEILDNDIDENCDGQIEMGISEMYVTFSLFPNPAVDQLNVQLSSFSVGSDLLVYDAIGKIVHKEQVLSTRMTISLSNFNSGNYMLKVGGVVKRFEVMN